MGCGMIAQIPVRLFVLTSLVLAVGCGGGSTSLEGVITLDGTPVSRGALSLVPVKGGPTVGAEIRDGSYAIAELSPGKYRADIMSFAQEEIVTSSAEMEQRSKAVNGSKVGGDAADDAEGNGVEFQVSTGAQTHDFALTSAK